MKIWCTPVATVWTVLMRTQRPIAPVATVPPAPSPTEYSRPSLDTASMRKAPLLGMKVCLSEMFVPGRLTTRTSPSNWRVPEV
jgi:hypothetical protein